MRANVPAMGKYTRTRLTVMRQAKSQDLDRYSIGGREKRETQPVPSLPKLHCLPDER